MASLLIGGAAGLAFGPVGFLVGSYVGNLLFPQKQAQTQNLHLQGSDYGTMIPILYGNFRVPGNVVWTTDLQPHTSKGKGSAGQVETYSASFQCLLCDRTGIDPIIGLNHIWADGTMIYDVNGTEASGVLPCTVYTGSETQGPDPTIQSVEGVGNVSASRGLAYVVFENWDLSPYGNRIPNLTFDVRAIGPQTQQITVVESNTTEPVTYTRPQITQFAYPSAIQPLMRVGEVGAGIVNSGPGNVIPQSLHLYNQDLSFNSVGTPTYPLDGVCQSVSVGGIWEYFGGGFFNGQPFWWTDGYHIGSAIGPVIASTDLGFSAGEATGTDWATVWGITAEAGALATVYAFLPSPDQTFVIIATGPSAGGATQWWIVYGDGGLGGGGTAYLGGSVTPGALEGTNATGGALSPPGFPTCVEQNGNWFWVYVPNAGAGQVHVATVDGSANIATYAPCGVCNMPGTGGGGVGSGIFSPAPGYAVVVTSNGKVALFTRFGPNPDQGIALSAIVSDLCNRAGLLSAQYNTAQLQQFVQGYCVSQQQACRDSITPLQSAYYFDAVESSGVLKFVPRGGASLITIPANDLAAQAGRQGSPPATVTVKRTQEVDLPAILYVKYANPDNDYQAGTQMCQRQVTRSQLTTTVDLTSIALTDTQGKQIAGTLIVAAWLERMQFTILTSFLYSNLEPTDCISFISSNGQEYFGRIMQKRVIASNILQFDITATLANVWNQGPVAGSGSGYRPSTPPVVQPLGFLPLNLPLITDTDPYPNGFYAGITLLNPGTFVGATLYESVDGGATYNTLAGLSPASVTGTTNSALGNFTGGNVFDHLNRVEVTLGTDGGTLSSSTYLGVLNGANMCVIGTEVLQFMTATLVSAGVYELSDFLRGRRGTEWNINGHASGEPFILLPVTDCNTPVSDLGQTRLFKAVPTGGIVLDATAVSFVNSGEGLRCYSPTEVYGAPDGSGNVTINWTRRTRIGGEWADFTDVPLSEASESYVLQIWNSTYTVCARVVGANQSNPASGPALISSPTFDYTAAMQVADFGQLQQTVKVTNGQNGAFGLGVQAAAAIKAGGSSNTSPSNPVTPYSYQNPGSPPSGGCTGNLITGPSGNTFTWAAEWQLPSGTFTAGDTWVLAIPVPSSPNPGLIKLQFTQTSGAPTVYCTILASMTPCGPPIIPAQSISGGALSNDYQLTWCIGPTSNPATTPQILPNTTVYVSVTVTGPCTVNATLTTQG